METDELKGIAEGLLFASGDEGISMKQLCRIIDVSDSIAQTIIKELEHDYERKDRGLIIIESRGILHLATKPEHSNYFKKLLELPHASKMSQAALETLAIIAYQQPITRTEIEEIRGVKSDRPVQTLLSRSLIEEIGRRESVGRPILFGTSKDFLIYFGLTSLEELPPLPTSTEVDENTNEADLFFKSFNDEMNSNLNE